LYKQNLLLIPQNGDPEDFRLAIESGLADEIANLPGVEAKVRSPDLIPGKLTAIDPGTVQVALTALSGTGAIAIAVKALFSAVELYIDRTKRDVVVKCGDHSLTLPANMPSADRKLLAEQFIRRCETSG
jgi:hypothetical protein